MAKRHLTFTGRFLLTYFIVMTIATVFTWRALGAEVNFDVKWAVNGMPDTGGFRLYKVLPNDQTEMVWDVPDATKREWSGPVTVEDGVNRFYMVSYSNDLESDRSEEFTYEWITPETPSGLPVPMVIIKFGNP